MKMKFLSLTVLALVFGVVLSTSAAIPAFAAQTPAKSAAPAANNLVDLNTASLAQLVRLSVAGANARRTQRHPAAGSQGGHSWR